MKKAISLFLTITILVAVLSACGASQQNVNVWQDTPSVPQTNDRLTVFCVGDLRDSGMIELALNRYRQLYPDIQVELIKPESENIEEREELYQQVAAQIMAGEGPDVFLVNPAIMDVEKLVRQGIFADMEPFFEADDFDWTPYHQAVMDGGVWNGKRFVIPLTYNFQLLFTTRTALEETGFDMDACKDYMGFLEETMRFMEDPAQTRQLCCKPMMIMNVVGISGITIADYDTRTIDLSSPVLQPGCAWHKTLNVRHPGHEITLGNDGLEYSAGAVRDGVVLFAQSLGGAFSGFFREFAALKTIDEAVMLPIRDVNGGIQAQIEYSVAVRGNSENLQNAYNYIKVLLSPEIQHKLQNGDQLSVLNSANEYGYEMISQGKLWHTKAGAGGFVGTVEPNQGTDWPSREEYDQLVGFINEIRGAYFISHLRFQGKMRPYVYENADYEETLENARREMEIYISE